ncbi:hypothetical protein C3432_17700 [Citrobacter amalonaticus]|uniref:Fimbrial-type adhesion domain-containing protein n=1 Tax=Citrobacter amalonaticus TaxID=35703 RepID=A0A2S4RTV1_CITAM|nr:fimbrial protein [Citrobacter amalonaticus]POT57189.1 hypothetical protein C3432_17700 [Citrobacter amalonaticus]POT72522.1 hypothetical protein C3436_20185 [Citrobacter amalonaticus]POU63377.1 hypothetical protein C3430_18440 [Citrobacter amalonaticus]POV03141.1 hypothetical protein C3424_21355 [Citrobacter amalonaticus]
MKLNIFLLNLLFICVGSAYAAQTVVMPRTGNTSSRANFTIAEDVTNKGGALLVISNLTLPSGETKFRAPARDFDKRNGRWTSSSPVIEGRYDTANVNTGDTINVSGKKYYRLKNITGTNIPVYIRLAQQMWLPNIDRYEYVDLLDLYFRGTSNDGLGWYEFNTNWSSWGKTTALSGCTKAEGNYAANVACDTSYITFTLGNQYNNRNIQVSFYMPRTPYSTITIPSMKVGQSSIHHMCIDYGSNDADYEAAKICTKGASTTPLIDYYIQGTVTFRTTCSVAETTKTIDLATTSVGKLVGKGQGGIPDGFTPKETKIALNCSGDINSSFTKGVVWSMTGVGDSLSAGAAQQGILLAKGTGINDLGVKITSDAAGKNLVKVDGTQTVQAEASGKTATAKFYAYPTAANASKAPTGAGNYEAMATLTFDMP